MIPKKLLTFFSLFIFANSLPASAQQDGRSQLEYSSEKGTPVVDGELDILWESIPSAAIERPAKPIQAGQGVAAGKFQSLWDEQFLYFRVEVTDDRIGTQNQSPWEQDSVEFFLDELNQKSESYQEDDGQFRISADGKISIGDSTRGKMKGVAKRTAKGYLLEVAIPWNKLKPAVGIRIGFDAQINDDRGNGRREAIIKWNQATDDSWRNTSGFGTIVLVGSDVGGVKEKTILKETVNPKPASSQAIDSTMKSTKADSVSNVPTWARDAIFYQIFPERFRNGDPGNDPTRESLEFVDIMPKSWRVTPWTSPWYDRSPWEKELGENFYEDGVFHRRYGGDLQGVVDKLDYLAELGINTIYFNPVFYARSLHKYDGNSFHHVDPYFGPDPTGDFALMAQETADPTTWKWTAADKLFLSLLNLAHQRKIRVIIDGVFNHTGRDFFAFADIAKNQQKSPYVDWYTIKSFDDSKTPENEFKYACWWGVDTLPEFANSTDGSDLHPAPKAYIFAATRRWMDPNGDGNPNDGIAGWRLDVANEVPNQFWRDWHAEVRRINPEAMTIAEIWEEASNYLADCQFSSTMNYHGFAFPVKGFLIDGNMKASQFAAQIKERLNSHPEDVQFGLQNLIDSHDTDRVASMIVNADRKHSYLQPQKHDYDVGERVSPRHFKEYDVSALSEAQQSRLRLFALFQFSFVGMPMIYYGTEAGMDGADDPCCRMPMVWNDLKYEKRTMGPYGPLEKPQPVGFDSQLHQYYQKLTAMRNQRVSLRQGSFEVCHADDSTQTIAFVRTKGDEQVLMLFNRGDQPAKIAIDQKNLLGGKLEFLLGSNGGTGSFISKDTQILIDMPAGTGQAWQVQAR